MNSSASEKGDALSDVLQMNCRKSRKPRTTKEQYAIFVSFLEKNPELYVSGASRFSSSNELQEKWKKIATKLNRCTNGPPKSSVDYESVRINFPTKVPVNSFNYSVLDICKMEAHNMV